MVKDSEALGASLHGSGCEEERDMDRKIKHGRGMAQIRLLVEVAAIVGCIAFIIRVSNRLESAGESMGVSFLFMALLFVGMYVAFFLQILIHEAGH